MTHLVKNQRENRNAYEKIQKAMIENEIRMLKTINTYNRVGRGFNLAFGLCSSTDYNTMARLEAKGLVKYYRENYLLGSPRYGYYLTSEGKAKVTTSGGKKHGI